MEKLANSSSISPPLQIVIAISKGIVSFWEAFDIPFRKPLAATVAKVFFGLFVVYAIYRSFTVGDAPNFQHPQLARILFWHLPCPILASFLLLQGAWWSLRYIRESKHIFDIKASAALSLGFVFCLLTISTGMVFSKAEWGAWWQWDPRQASFLLVILINSAYFVIRQAYPDPARRASMSGTYALAAALPTLFLIYVFPRLPQIADSSLHPTNSIMSGDIHGGYATCLLLTIFVTTVYSIWQFRMRVRVGVLEQNLYERN